MSQEHKAIAQKLAELRPGWSRAIGITFVECVGAGHYRIDGDTYDVLQAADYIARNVVWG